jgi:hypothetical protein
MVLSLVSPGILGTPFYFLCTHFGTVGEPDHTASASSVFGAERALNSLRWKAPPQASTAASHNRQGQVGSTGKPSSGFPSLYLVTVWILLACHKDAGEYCIWWSITWK